LMTQRLKRLYSTYFFFFCPIDLIIHTKLAIWGKLKNCPSDCIDVNCHCGHGGSSNVEKTVLKPLEPCIGWMLNEFHWSRHKAGWVSIVVLEKHTVKLPGSILIPSDSISGQNTILKTCIVTVSPLKVGYLCTCREAGTSSTLSDSKNHTKSTRPLSKTNWILYMLPAVIARLCVW